MIRRLFLTAAAFLAATAPALAHLDPAEHGSFLAGASHPLFGADHVLAMVAVGLWAATLGGRAVLGVPAAFVGTMALGFLVALAGLPLPFVEPAILASVVALGLLVALGLRVPAGPAAAIVAVFALFHGHAHGGELGSAGAAPYFIGFALSTALLHGAGIALGLSLGRISAVFTRTLGAATALAGLAGLALMVGA